MTQACAVGTNIIEMFLPDFTACQLMGSQTVDCCAVLFTSSTGVCSLYAAHDTYLDASECTDMYSKRIDKLCTK